jgi:hypothetical protein
VKRTARLLLALLHFLRQRLGEPSSIRGLVWIATGGLTQLTVADPVSVENAASIGMIVAGVLGILLPDPKGEKSKSGEAPK